MHVSLSLRHANLEKYHAAVRRTLSRLNGPQLPGTWVVTMFTKSTRVTPLA